ncbi:DUF2336 domain-containing protein [Kordiimonas gwangyangensis]|uniref:DUF2336 domain-containing protein n=1 Tax=Kordiimonas gwangyangensis TaxID=288022 RepID=UPI000361E5E3|nr:DUF2336 domain-containing protein [Kordiimonas gwangyangensis]
MSIDVAHMQELRNIDLEARVEIARKVGRILTRESEGGEHEDALQLAQLLVEDAAVSVREALAKELRSCSFLPSDLVAHLVQDIDQVSMPFLMASQAIDDAFLEDIVRSCGSAQQEAIAQRSQLSEAVSYAISDVGSLGAVNTLVANEGATMSSRSHNRVMERFPEERSLMEKMSERADLPAELVERIIFKVSKRYGEYLSEKFGLATDYASYLVSMANRQVFSRTLEMAPQSEIKNYLQQLHSVDSLSSDVLLNYLQNGNVRLFTMALAVRLDRSYEAVEAKLALGDKKIVARLLEAAGFSKSVIGVLLIAFERLIRGH